MKKTTMIVCFIAIAFMQACILSMSTDVQAATEVELKLKLEKETSETIKKFYYADLDNNGEYEAVAVTADSEDYYEAKLWFVSSTRCENYYTAELMIYPESINLCDVTEGKMLILEEGGGGSDSTSHAWIFDQYGAARVEVTGMNISYEGKNKFTTQDSQFDAFVNAETYEWTGHTYNQYYFEWNGSEMVEYGGASITEKQFKKYTGGKRILKKIKKQGEIQNIYLRSNKIVNINYRVYQNSRKTSWNNKNITLKINKGKVKYVNLYNWMDTAFDKATGAGIYKPNLTEENVFFPKIFKKKKDGNYSASHVDANDVDNYGYARKITLKKKKIVVIGSFRKYDSAEAYWCGQYEYLEERTRSFKLAKNVKYYSTGGAAGTTKISRKQCKSLCNNVNGLEFKIVVKNGKVIEIYFCS